MIQRFTHFETVAADARPRRSLGAALILATLLTGAGSTTMADEAREPDAPPRRRATAFDRGAGGAMVGFDGVLGIGATVVLAIAGGAIVLRSRFQPANAAGTLRVVGRAQLNGRHAVYLLRAGDRTLIVGVGAQGPPALLGELEPSGEAPRAASGAGDRTGERA